MSEKGLVIDDKRLLLPTIDVNFNFTCDCAYWDSYDNHRSDTDPDIHSPTLRLYQQILYSRQTPSGQFLQLEQGKNAQYDYLVCDGRRFASDNIINMFERYKMPWPRELEIENYNDRIKDYKQASYVLGGEIIFPKHQDSINQCRGINDKILDRFDLTLECIKRFYEGKPNPLNDVLSADKEFFDLFVDFPGYVNFFFLDDLISPDSGRVKLFLGDDNDVFMRSPMPQNKQEWDVLHERQMDFLQQRTNRIKQFITADL